MREATNVMGQRGSLTAAVWTEEAPSQWRLVSYQIFEM